MPYHYKIYGLHLQSSRPLSLLTPQRESTPDLIVHWVTNNSDSPDLQLDWEQVFTNELKQKKGITLWRTIGDNGTYTKFRYDTTLAFIDFLLEPSKKTLWIIHNEHESESDLQSYLVGPALGCVLRLRGLVCLHASVVNIDNHAVAILGNKKAGKSTNAASLLKCGMPLLSDDMAVITKQDGKFIVHPGYPQVRLWQSSIEALYGEKNIFPKVYSSRDKRYVKLSEADKEEGMFCTKPLPLSAIYYLDELNGSGETKPYIEVLPPRLKLIRLIENTFGSYVVTDDFRQKEFSVLAQISRTTPVRCLRFGNDLATLPLQSKTILEDFRTLVGANR